MRVDDDAVLDDEAPRQLHPVAHRRADDVTFARRDDPVLEHLRVVRDLTPRAARKVVQVVSSALGIDEGFERHGPRCEEGLQILGHSLPDNDDPYALRDELPVIIAQLRDVPAAERSAVVAEEDQGHRLLGPKRRKVRRRAVQRDDFGVGRTLTNRGMHARERTGWKWLREIGERTVPCVTL